MTGDAGDDHFLEESAEDLYEHAPCGYISTLENGSIVRINQTLLTWLGYERHEIVKTKRVQDLINIGGRIFFETHFMPLLRMQGYVNEINFDFVCKNKQQIPVLTSTVQRRRTEGSVPVNLMTIFNITDRKKYERELLFERQKAQKAARAKADFLSMMSHEIRTPLNAVVGIATLLERTTLSEQQQEYTSMLKTSSENLMNLLNSILDFSKIEAGKMMIEDRNFNLPKLLEDSLRGLAGRAEEKGLQIRLNLDDRLPKFFRGDPVKIGQVLTNFVGNAIKFTEHGTIDVNVISLGHTETTASIHFEVQDTGIGISPDRLPQIFDEFIQADYEIGMKYGGSGLGLAISSRLVEMHGSQIKVESHLGQGSKFSFDLELKIGKTEQQQPSRIHGIQESGLLTGVRVLVAEDNKDNVFIIERLLRSWGVNLEVATTGREAVERATSSSFDLILMDLRMPVLNGYEATTVIRESNDPRLKKIPIIAFSASTKMGETDLIEVTAFNDFVGKPFQPEELFTKLAYHTGRSSTLVAGSTASSADSTAQPESATTNAGERAFFTLDGYLEILDSDQEALREVLSLVVNSYADAQKEIADAMSRGELGKLEFQAHRIKSSMEILKAQPLSEALETGRGALTGVSSIESAAANLEIVFEATIAGLKSSLASLPKPYPSEE